MSSASSDEALLAGMAQGDEASAIAFFRRYQRRVYGLASSMIADSGVAEDVAQEAMLRVWKHAPVYDARRGSVTTWVLTITRNLSIDALRLRRAVPVDPDDFLAAAFISEDRAPDDLAVARSSGDAVRAGLASLPAEQQRALILAAVYGRTGEEISREEQIPLGTAKTRVRTAMRRLRVSLAEEAKS